MKAITVALFSIFLAGSALACPQVDQQGTELYFTAAELHEGKAFDAVAGGSQNISKCNFPGLGTRTGFVSVAPDFKLHYSEARGYQLEIRVTSACDSVLLINTANGNWYYDDDDAGAGDALIRLSIPSEGWYEIWIGTYTAGNCDAKLILESF